MNHETADLRLRYDSNGDEDTDETAELVPAQPPVLPMQPRRRRAELGFATTELLPHPRLIRREALPRTRFARASSPLQSPPWAPDAPMFLTPKPRVQLPPPLRHRSPPPPLRPVTQAEDEIGGDALFTEDPETQPFR